MALVIPVTFRGLWRPKALRFPKEMEQKSDSERRSLTSRTATYRPMMQGLKRAACYCSQSPGVRDPEFASLASHMDCGASGPGWVREPQEASVLAMLAQQPQRKDAFKWFGWYIKTQHVG